MKNIKVIAALICLWGSFSWLQASQARQQPDESRPATDPIPQPRTGPDTGRRDMRPGPRLGDDRRAAFSAWLTSGILVDMPRPNLPDEQKGQSQPGQDESKQR